MIWHDMTFYDHAFFLLGQIADSDEGGHMFRSKADSVPIDCGQHSDDPGQGAHVDSSKGVMTPGWRQVLTF
jgi:hypothetical protein